MWLRESRNLCELPGREGLTKLPHSEIVQRFIIFLAEPWNSPAAMITKILFNQTSKVQMVRTGFLIKIHIRLLERFKRTISDKLHLIFSCEQRTNIWVKVNQYDSSVCWQGLLGLVHECSEHDIDTDFWHGSLQTVRTRCVTSVVQSLEQVLLIFSCHSKRPQGNLTIEKMEKIESPASQGFFHANSVWLLHTRPSDTSVSVSKSRKELPWLDILSVSKLNITRKQRRIN